jgi:hypothetical protein
VAVPANPGRYSRLMSDLKAGRPGWRAGSGDPRDERRQHADGAPIAQVPADRRLKASRFRRAALPAVCASASCSRRKFAIIRHVLGAHAAARAGEW